MYRFLSENLGLGGLRKLGVEDAAFGEERCEFWAAHDSLQEVSSALNPFHTSLQVVWRLQKSLLVQFD